MITKVKLGATIAFDLEHERDIVALLDDLRQSHKLGEYISHTIRYAVEHQEDFEKETKVYARLGVSNRRKEFFDKAEQSLRIIAERVNEIYRVTNNLKALAQFNKKLGLLERVDSAYMAQFVVQKQINDLCRILGVNSLESKFASNKLHDINNDIDSVIEFIITYYDGIVSEIRESVEEAKSRERVSASDSAAEIAELKEQLRRLTESSYLKGVADEATEAKRETAVESEPAVPSEPPAEFAVGDSADLAGIADLVGDI